MAGDQDLLVQFGGAFGAVALGSGAIKTFSSIAKTNSVKYVAAR